MTESRPSHPLLMFPQLVESQRETLPQGRPRGFRRRPTSGEQGQRHGRKWEALRAALSGRTAELTSDLGSTDPELVLVIEIIGEVEDFYRAVQRIEGLEFLAEVDEEDIDGAGLFVDADDPDRTFNGTLYLMATNQQALEEILQLWAQYQADERQPFPRNLGRWKEVFRLLSDVRRWSPQDRLRGTGVLEDFADRQAAGQEVVPAEIELWYRDDQPQRSIAESTIRQLVDEAGGETLAVAEIESIAYHALLVLLPIQSIEPLLQEDPGQVELIRAEEVAFLRPEMQAAVYSEATTEPSSPFAVEVEPSEELQPLVAVLDGLPVANHELLGTRIVIDDPDDWASEIPARSRVHGTAIASLVLHGDGGRWRSLRTPIYVRPVLRPEDNIRGHRETIPHGILPIDLIHGAVLRMVGPGGVAPTVKVVNLSIGDAYAQLANRLSPWARLLDWLSYTYGILFIVSAGNHPRSLVYPWPLGKLEAMSPEKLRQETLRVLVNDSPVRRILSPSECMNGLCVGAAHQDDCNSWVAGARRDMLPGDDQPEIGTLPSPISAVGMGYRRSIKPDILAPGGRVLFRLLPASGNHAGTVANIAASPLAPGLQVASPSAHAGVLNGTQFFHGTSGAAAIASHFAGLAVEELAILQSETGDLIDPRYWAVLAKTLLVHSTQMPMAASYLRDLFGNMRPDKLRDAISRFYGYGIVNSDRLLSCTAERATALGWGELRDGQAAQFEFPLPPSLAGRPVPRHVSMTVAYFSPIRSRDRRHRAIQLFLRPDRDLLRIERTGPDWRTVRRGTVQHETLTGDQATAYVDGDSLRITVNCRSVVGTLAQPILFGLAVSLEVDAVAAVPVYAEVAERIRLRARARARA